jgi:hypothetical protein
MCFTRKTLQTPLLCSKSLITVNFFAQKRMESNEFASLVCSKLHAISNTRTPNSQLDRCGFLSFQSNHFCPKKIRMIYVARLNQLEKKVFKSTRLINFKINQFRHVINIKKYDLIKGFFFFLANLKSILSLFMII